MEEHEVPEAVATHFRRRFEAEMRLAERKATLLAWMIIIVVLSTPALIHLIWSAALAD